MRAAFQNKCISAGRGSVRVALAAAAFLTLAITHSGTASAQTAELTMSADRTTVAIGGRFQLTIQLSTEGIDSRGVVLPDLSKFQIAAQSESTPMRFEAQGRIVQSMTVTTFSLVPVEAGTVEIAPATFRLGNRVVRSAPVRITVTDSGAPIVPNQDPTIPPTGPLEGARYDAEGFLRTVVHNSDPFVGEQVTVTIYIYVPEQLGRAPGILAEPSTDNLITHNLLPANRTLEARTQVVSGKRFSVYLIRRFAAFPTSAGEATIGPMRLSVQTAGGGSFFQRTAGRSFEYEGVPVMLSARALPAAPADSPGPAVVGEFELEARIDPAQVATGNAVTVRAEVTGSGNIQDLALSLPARAGLRILEPEVRDDVTISDDVVAGSRTWEWLVVPETEGEHTLGPLRLLTFSPQTETFRVLESSSLMLRAAGAAVALPTAGTEPGENVIEGAAVVPSFGPARTESGLRRKQNPISQEGWYLASLALPPALLTLFLLGLVVARRRRPDLATEKARLTRKRGERLLTEARAKAKAGDASGFYGAVRLALLQMLESSFGQPVAGFTLAELRSHLRENGVDAELADDLANELESSEFARFSSAASSGDEVTRTLARVEKLIQRLQAFRPPGASS